MGIFSDYKYEFNQCVKEVHTEDIVYTKVDKRFKGGRKIVSRKHYEGLFNLGDIIYRNDRYYYLVESLAQCNCLLYLVWTELVKNGDGILGKIIYSMFTHIIPFFPIIVIIKIMTNHWKTRANIITKIAFTLYCIFVLLIILSLYTAIVMGIIYLVKKV